MRQIIMSILLLTCSFFVWADSYRVELCVFEKQVSMDYFKGINNVQLAIDRNDLYRYYVGDFEDIKTAESIRKMAIVKGMKYAKVINFTAMKLACINACTAPEKINHLFFDFEEYTLRPQSKADLNRLSSYLHNNTNYKVRLEGHTDSKGSIAYNKALAHNRAMAAKQYLLKEGIEQNRVLISQFGESNPIAKNELLGEDSPTGRQYNRRVMLTILDEVGLELEYIVRPIQVPELLKYEWKETAALLTMTF